VHGKCLRLSGFGQSENRGTFSPIVGVRMGPDTKEDKMTLKESRKSITGTGKEDVEELKFRCPECGSDKLDYAEVVVNEVKSARSDEEFELVDERHDESLGYHCQKCGYVLEEEYGPVISRRDLVDWLKANCEQGI
jgi:rubredoxin